MSKYWFLLIYLRITWKIGLVFPAITNQTILKNSTAIDSSQRSPDRPNFFPIFNKNEIKGVMGEKPVLVCHFA